jgi:hypothetical protein
MATKSPTKKTARSLSKGGLSSKDHLDLLSEMEETKDKNIKSKTTKRKGSKRKSVADPEMLLPLQLDLPQKPMTKEEIERENQVLKNAEEKLEGLKVQTAEKEIIFNKLLLELKRMLYIFSKVKEIDINTPIIEVKEEPKVSY